MERVKFAKQRSTTFDPTSKGVQKQLTKFMRHFAESNGVTGTWTRLWSQKTPIAKHGELDLDIHYLKDFENCLKKGVEFDKNGEYIMHEREHTQKINEKKNPIRLIDGTIVQPNEPYYYVRKIVTNEKDWKSAWMYYRVAMDLGWRAEEAFTAGANRSLDPKLTGVSEEKTPDGDIFVMLRIMTRKTAWVNRSHHGGSIVTPETMKLIREKRDLVDKYSDTSKYSFAVAKEHGVIQSYISTEVDQANLKKEDGRWIGLPEKYGKSVPNKIHALVGEDGYFTKIETMEYPSNARMSKSLREQYKDNNWQVPQVRPIQSNRRKIHAIMRHCYAEIFADKKDMYLKYFKFHSLHALRHLFAQYWLTATARKNDGVRDYAMVMKMGHWNGVDILMNFYGQQSNVQITKRAMDIRTDYEALAEAQRKEREEREKNKSLEEELDNVDSDEDSEDDMEETTDELQ